MRPGVRVVVVLGGVLLASSLCSAAPVMVEKNLFAQDRRPPPPESATAARQSNKPGVSHNAIQLDGIIIHGDSKKALLRYKGQVPGAEKKKGQSPYVTVREGQRFGDYQVVKIESKSISLEKDGQVFVISLFSDGKVVTPLPAAAPPPQVQNPPPPQPGQPPEMRGGRIMPVQPPMPEGGGAPGNPNAAGQAVEPGAAQPGIAPEAAPAQPQPEEEPLEEEEVIEENAQ